MKTPSTQPCLPGLDSEPSREDGAWINRLDPQDRAFHDWYRFVLSYPPHLVRHYLQDFGLDRRQTLLDPFCGTGTTLIAARLAGIPSIGLEANPFAHFASSVKVDWSLDPAAFLRAADEIASTLRQRLQAHGINDTQLQAEVSSNTPLRSLPSQTAKLLIAGSISPLPLHKTLVLLDCIEHTATNPTTDMRDWL